MSDGLTAQERKSIRAVFAQIPAIERAILFGSRAMGVARSNSDVDIALVGASLSSQDILRALSLLEASSLPYQFDLILYDTIKSSELLEHIRKYGKEMYMKAGRAGELEGWKEVSFSKCVLINPKIKISKWSIHNFVEMKDIECNIRYVKSSTKRAMVYGGSKFISDDIIFARITPCLENGKIAQYKTNDTECAFGSTEFIIFREKENFTLNNFIYYRVINNDFREFAISQMSGTSGRQRVPVESLDNFTFLLPPLHEQQAIAHILGTLDDKIELNRRQNATLEAMAQAIFKDWFVDFGPVRAKMEGRQPEGMSREIADLFPDRLDDEGKPEGWKRRKLGDFFPVITGKKDANYASSTGIYPFFTCAQEQTLVCDLYSFEGSAILLAGNGDFNIKWYRGRFEAYQRTYVLIPYNQRFISILYTLMKYYLIDITVGHKGTVINYITKSMITDYSVILPENSVIEILSSVFGSIFEKIEKILFQTKTLTALRDTLLPKLISGELRIPDAEKMVAELV